jgi:plastocyanin
MRRIRAASRVAPFALAALLAGALQAACSAFVPEIGSLRGTDDAAEGGADAADAAAAESGADGADEVSAPDTGPRTVTVTVGPNGARTFNPAALEVRVGDTVHWVWSSSGHTVTSGNEGNADGLFCSPSDTGCAGAPTSRAGDTYDHRFLTAGTFPYHCRPHSGMTGSITVK